MLRRCEGDDGQGSASLAVSGVARLDGQSHGLLGAALCACASQNERCNRSQARRCPSGAYQCLGICSDEGPSFAIQSVAAAIPGVALRLRTRKVEPNCHVLSSAQKHEGQMAQYIAHWPGIGCNTHPIIQGSITSMPASMKSRTFRVATAMRRERAMAAIWHSG